MSDLFYNKKTYAPKWETSRNEKKAAKLKADYPTECISNCPCSWVDEVEELLKTITQKPEVELRQFKEKRGSLRVYYGCKPKTIRAEVDKLIDKCMIKLTRKLKYPYKIYKCSECKEKMINCLVKAPDYTTPLCRYCKAELNGKTSKNKTGKTSKSAGRKKGVKKAPKASR